jgi:hypothetical protein
MPVTLKSGFFNSTDGTDHLYDMDDFREYLKGIIKNGCLPNDTGFQVVVDDGPIAGNPNSAPSVVIKAGKAYFDGLWVVSDSDFVYVLGDGQQVADGMYHLLYFCFDTNDAGRTVTIEHIVNTNASLAPGSDGTPADGEGKYYMPIAKITDAKGVQPSEINDLRWKAGVAATGVHTDGLDDYAVTNSKMARKSVDTNVLDDKAVKAANVDDKAIGFAQINGPTIMGYAALAADKSAKAMVQLGPGAFEFTASPAIDGRVVVTGYISVDGSTLGTTSPLCRFYVQKNIAGARTVLKSIYHHATKGEWFAVPFQAMVDVAAGATVKIEVWARCDEEPITVKGGSSFMAMLLPK